MLTPAAFVMAVECSVTMQDAFYFGTGLMFGCQVVVVDDDQIQAAARVAQRYPRLLVTHLSDALAIGR